MILRQAWIIVCSATLIWPVAVNAQRADEPDLKIATVNFAPAERQDGYGSARVNVKYRLIQCDGAVYIAYGLDPMSLTVSKQYFIGKEQIDPNVPPPRVETVRFVGFIKRFDATLGYVEDLAGPALGFGCFTGQTRKVAEFTDIDGYKKGMNSAQIQHLLNEYEIQPNAMPDTLKNAAIRDRIPPIGGANSISKGTARTAQKSGPRGRGSGRKSSLTDGDADARDGPETPSKARTAGRPSSSDGEIGGASTAGREEHLPSGAPNYFACQYLAVRSPIYSIDSDAIARFEGKLLGDPSAVAEMEQGLGKEVLSSMARERWLTHAFIEAVGRAGFYDHRNTWGAECKTFDELELAKLFLRMKRDDANGKPLSLSVVPWDDVAGSSHHLPPHEVVSVYLN